MCVWGGGGGGGGGRGIILSHVVHPHDMASEVVVRMCGRLGLVPTHSLI